MKIRSVNSHDLHPEQGRPSVSSLWTLPAIALIVFAAGIPMFVLIVEAVETSSVWETITRSSVIEAFRFSLLQALASTVLTLSIGAVIAWVLAQYEFFGRTFVRATLTIPFVLPTVVVGAAFIALLPSSMERSLLSVLLAHVFFNISVVIRMVTPVWSLVDSNLLSAARTLGASPIRVILRIIAPVARPAIGSASALVFLMSFTSYGIVRILGEPGARTLEVEIYRRAVLLGDISGATVLALVQTVVIIAIFSSATRRAATEMQRIDVRRRSAPRWAIVFAFGLTGLVLTPLLTVIVRSIRVAGRWTLNGWRTVFGDSELILSNLDLTSTITRSLVFAMIAAAIAVPAGVAAAIGLSHRRNRWTRAVIVAPMATSAVVIGFGILITYDTNPYDFRSQWWLIPVVHAVVALPFVVRSALPVAESIPNGHRDAAATLGASPARRWLRIDLPLMAPALATSLGLSAALSLGEFGATSFLTRRDTATLPIVIDQLLGRAGETAFTASMVVASTLLIITVLIVATFDSSLRT